MVSFPRYELKEGAVNIENGDIKKVVGNFPLPVKSHIIGLLKVGTSHNRYCGIFITANLIIPYPIPSGDTQPVS